VLANKIRERLVGRIPDQLLDSVPASFDILGSKSGSVVIIEVPEELVEYERALAEAVMGVHGNVKSVLGKESGRQGEYRLRELRLILGDADTEVEHRESGCRFMVDPNLAYFSTRESTERERVASQVQPGEEVLVMFSGVAPYPISIAKSVVDARVTGVEINPDAHHYGLINVKLNKVQDRVRLLLGDVRDVCPALAEQFDRVVMPLPKGAHEFLDLAVSMLRAGGTLHFYHWAPENDLFTEAMILIKQAAERQGRDSRFLGGVKVSLYSPRVCKVRVDAEVR
jgi:tRNA (guanine37-N1)-methyltransferase